MKSTIDIKKAIENFFKLPDWAMRVLMIGGPVVLGVTMYYIGSFLAIIPFIGMVISCFVSIAVFAFYIIYQIFIKGYQYDLIKTVAENKNVEFVAVYDFSSERMTNGLKLILATIIYNIPTVALYAFAFTAIFLGMFLLPNSSDSSQGLLSTTGGIIAMIAFLVLILFAIVYQLICQFVLIPSATYLYHKHQNITSMFKFRELWTFIKSNSMNLILFGAVSFGISIAFSVLYLISSLLILVCIGILIFPVVWAFQMTFLPHVKAHMLGQMCRENN